MTTSLISWLDYYSVPSPGESDEKQRFIARPGFLAWLKPRTVDAWKTPIGARDVWFEVDGLPVHSSHQWPGAVAKISLRECVPFWSCQIVLFLAMIGTVLAYQIDFDEENPLGGAYPAGFHFARVVKRFIVGGSTKEQRICKGLLSRGIPLVEGKEAV